MNVCSVFLRRKMTLLEVCFWILLFVVTAFLVTRQNKRNEASEDSMLFSRVTAPVNLEHGGLIEITALTVDEPRHCFKPASRRMWAQALVPGAVTFWTPEARESMESELYRSGFVGFERVTRMFGYLPESETIGQHLVARVLAVKSRYAQLPRCPTTVFF